MAWVRLDDQVPQHPKILKAGPAAAWLWVCGIAYCARHLTDGHVPREALPTFGVPGALKLADALVRAGLWERRADGFDVHDYQQYQPSRHQVHEKRRASAERINAWRVKHGMVGKHALVTALQRENERVCNAVTNTVGNTNPIPNPNPIPIEEPRGCGARATGKPLGYRPRVDVAWPGRPHVPGGLHAEFIDKLGGDPADADARLRAWYPDAAKEFQDQPIGDDDWRFWRARFREWVGTTVLAQMRSATPPPTYGEVEWCNHEPRCNSRDWHDVLVQRGEAAATREEQLA